MVVNYNQSILSVMAAIKPGGNRVDVIARVGQRQKTLLDGIGRVRRMFREPVLDYGYGCALISKRPPGLFKTVICLYVLDILLPVRRDRALHELDAYLEDDGILVVGASSRESIERTAKAEDLDSVLDGYYTGAGNFIRGFTHAEMVTMMDAYGFRLCWIIDAETYIFAKKRYGNLHTCDAGCRHEHICSGDCRFGCILKGEDLRTLAPYVQYKERLFGIPRITAKRFTIKVW